MSLNDILKLVGVAVATTGAVAGVIATGGAVAPAIVAGCTTLTAGLGGLHVEKIKYSSRDQKQGEDSEDPR